MDRIYKYLILMGAIIVIDQITKGLVQQNFNLGESVPIIDGLFSLTYVRNPGAAFGFGAGSNDIFRLVMFKMIPVLACIWLAYLVWTTRKANALLGVAYTLILAGAIGNLWDRFTLNYVVDFLDFYYRHHHFPAFNVADSAITIAAGLIIIDYFKNQKKGASRAQEES